MIKTPYDSKMATADAYSDRQVVRDLFFVRQGWLERDAQAKLEQAELLAACEAALPAIRWGITHQPGNLNQWRDCEAQVLRALTKAKGEA